MKQKCLSSEFIEHAVGFSLLLYPFFSILWTTRRHSLYILFIEKHNFYFIILNLFIFNQVDYYYIIIMYRYVQVPGIINMYEIPGPGVLIIMLRRCIGINTPLHASVIKKTNILVNIIRVVIYKTTFDPFYKITSRNSK